MTTTNTVARKSRTDAWYDLSLMPYFFCCRKCKISFVRRTAFILALKHPSPFLLRKFSTSSTLPWQKRQVADLLIFSGSLSLATKAWPWSFSVLPCFSVFTFQIFKRFFNRNFWSPYTKWWCGNWRVAFSAWLLLQLLQPCHCSWLK